jgi:L-aminopeptidase/D-esterase-like protein
MFDGDTVFAVATRARPLASTDAPFGPMARAAALDRLCATAALVFARAVVHGVLSATPLAGLAAYRDIWPPDAR